MKIVFFGTSNFAAAILDYLLDHSVDVVAVVTKPDRPQGRSKTPVPTPTKIVAEKRSIPLYQPEIASSMEFAETLCDFNADLFIVAAYGEIIKQQILDIPKLACINVHASLLPKYRGAAPIQRAIMNGEIETGVAIMHMVRKLDAGDLIKMRKVEIDNQMNAGELEKILCRMGAETILEVLQEFQNGIFQRFPQDHREMTYAPKIELEECEIKWNLPAEKLHNLIRGVTPNPGAWCYVTLKIKGKPELKRLKILKARPIGDLTGIPGTILDQESLLIACGSGALELLEVQLEGRKAMSAKELMRGIKIDDLSFKNLI